jgi:hypothetical protein
MKSFAVRVTRTLSTRLQTAAFKAGFRWPMPPEAECKHLEANGLVFYPERLLVFFTELTDPVENYPDRCELPFEQALSFFTGISNARQCIDCTIQEEA